MLVEYLVILLKHFIAYNMIKLKPCEIQARLTNGLNHTFLTESKKAEIKL
jgi:hypothetical protein